GEGLLARAICHELDHLDGVLYKDLVVDGLYSVEPPEKEN
ncbi:MAG: peptide deformylase, partial [Lachnospiraceae bacterium]|nr:peptide deformylase [Lachnospiraceae bacterium]